MYKRIIVAVDGSDTSDLALAAAISLAQAFSGRMRLINVVDEMAWLTGYDAMGDYSGQLVAAMRDWGNETLRAGMDKARAAGIEADCMLFDKFGQRLGETVAEACKLWNADLLVVGTHGRKGVSRLLMGSGAEQIIRMAPVPVLVVRGTEKVEAAPAA